ncbi:MAG TPA: TlpA disulfide reductase family protein [Steroidobacteraceae bacterium]|nr:TlpA disulfide reductase family protein [Steroidobacteraceae bacterium]
MSRPLSLTLAGFAVLGAAVVGAFVHERLHPGAALLAPAAPPAAIVSNARVGTAEVVSPVIPERRPLFALKDLDGKSHSISEWDGKALMVNFWATWCAPCRREIPLLNKIRREYAANGIEIVGIAVDFADDVRAYASHVPIAYPVLVGEQEGLEAARAFGVASAVFPFTAFTDSHGRVLTIHLGELHEPDARAILAVVRRVDAGALTPLEAREAIRIALAALPPAPTAPAL